MVGPVLSVLLLGIVPVWGLGDTGIPVARDLAVARPVASALTLSVPRSLAGSLSASGAVIIDLDSAQVVYAKNALQPRPMASLTKLMTALVIVENHALDERVVITNAVVGTEGNVARLTPGDEYELGALLTVMLVHSANDAAIALAVHHSGSEDAFVEEMNARAASLGLHDTLYRSATGFDVSGQHSTPRDLALLTEFVLNVPAIAERMSMSSATIASRSGTSLTFLHTHELLRQQGGLAATPGRPLVRAGKTGTTDGAKQCLLSMFEEDGRRYAAVLLHSDDRYGDMRRILSAFAAATIHDSTSTTAQ